MLPWHFFFQKFPSSYFWKSFQCHFLRDFINTCSKAKFPSDFLSVKCMGKRLYAGAIKFWILPERPLPIPLEKSNAGTGDEMCQQPRRFLCAGVSLTTSDVKVTGDTIYRTGLRRRKFPFGKRSLPFLGHLENFVPFIESVPINKERKSNVEPDLSYPNLSP